jgi:flagellar basal body rod protein FlgG
MLRGLYTATAGMASEMAAIDVLTNNLANSDTTGFKEDFETLVRQGANPLSYGEGGLVRGTGVLNVRTSIDLTEGSLDQTGNPLDLALLGTGMFGLQTAQGTVYTRDGRFHLSATRQLIAADGSPVLGANGAPITLPDPQGQPIVIGPTGAITVNGATVGTVGIFTASGWQNAGNGAYRAAGPVTAAPAATMIKQGMLEAANLDLTQAMGMLMTIERAYQAASQMQHMQDQLAQQAANDVGKLP